MLAVANVFTQDFDEASFQVEVDVSKYLRVQVKGQSVVVESEVTSGVISMFPFELSLSESM